MTQSNVPDQGFPLREMVAVLAESDQGILLRLNKHTRNIHEKHKLEEEMKDAHSSLNICFKAMWLLSAL